MKGYIETVELFPKLNNMLINLLSSLSIDEFHEPTQFPTWKVKDICAHLLDSSIRRLSGSRDSYQSLETPKIEFYDDLIEYITNIADRWTLAFSGVSPRIIIKLIDQYQTELYEYLKTLKPFERSFFAVSWAGEQESYNWFDIAREYTERWHHQMQIREALHKESLYQDNLYYPVLDTFMRALPYHYRNWKMNPGYVLSIGINGKTNWEWHLEWDDEIKLITSPINEPQTKVMIDQDKVWKILTRWNDRSAYKIEVEGNTELGNHFLEMNCVLIKQ